MHTLIVGKTPVFIFGSRRKSYHNHTIRKWDFHYRQFRAKLDSDSLEEFQMMEDKMRDIILSNRAQRAVFITRDEPIADIASTYFASMFPHMTVYYLGLAKEDDVDYLNWKNSLDNLYTLIP